MSRRQVKECDACKRTLDEREPCTAVYVRSFSGPDCEFDVCHLCAPITSVEHLRQLSLQRDSDARKRA